MESGFTRSSNHHFINQVLRSSQSHPPASKNLPQTKTRAKTTQQLGFASVHTPLPIRRSQAPVWQRGRDTQFPRVDDDRWQNTSHGTIHTYYALSIVRHQNKQTAVSTREAGMIRSSKSGMKKPTVSEWQQRRSRNGLANQRLARKSQAWRLGGVES